MHIDHHKRKDKKYYCLQPHLLIITPSPILVFALK